MTEPRGGWSDQRVEQTIGNLLRIGLLLATAVVILGAAVYLSRHAGETPNYRVFRGEPADLRGVAGIVDLARQDSGRGIIQLGLLILLATPVARVAFSIAAFVLQRDPVYVAITMIVLAVLLYSLAAPHG